MPLKPEQAIIYNADFPKYAGKVEGTQLADWEKRIDMSKMRKDRHAKFVQDMKDRGITVALIVERRNVRYTTGYNAASYEMGIGWAIVPVEGTPILWAHVKNAGDIQTRREFGWIPPEDIRAADFPLETSPMPEMQAERREELAKEIKGELEYRKLDKEVLVLDGSYPRMEAALEKVGIKTRVDPDMGIDAMSIKTPEEIECFRVLAAICDIVHWDTARYARPGLTELDITGYFRHRAMQLGCECEAGGFTMSGEHTFPNIRVAGHRIIRPGDIVYWDPWGLTWNGYRSCYYRTFIAGFKAPQRVQDAIKVANEKQYNAITAAKPGNTTTDMLKASGSGFIHIHGLGLECYVLKPVNSHSGLSKDYPCELKEGMVFAMTVNASNPGELSVIGPVGDGQGVDIEDMVLVTKTGAEVLTRFPSDVVLTVPLEDDQGYVYRSPEDYLREAKIRLNLPE
ncbi:M24 family metallopeptidase [Chloroflexota bacterium]